jgi:subtilisin family serine protease/subtilisin-like proprotein convertase family protein
MKTKLSTLSLALLPVLGMAAPVEKITYDENSILVVYKETASLAQKLNARALVSASIRDLDKDEKDDRFKYVLKGNLAKYNLGGKMSVKDAIVKLSAHPAVKFAEPNYQWKINFVPDDEYFDLMWSLNNTGQTGGVEDADIDAVEAWDITTGSSDIVVGVIDTGVQYTHPDLDSNIWVNPGEIADNGIDDDANGYVDDIYGIDTANGDSDPMDDQGHGTHVSGTIGAEAGGGQGVVGINHQVSIVGCKFLTAAGTGATDDAIECIDYMVALKMAGVNLKVLNNSWGGGGYSVALEEAIETAADADILFAVAAGNDGVDNDVSPSYPASYETENVFAVASTNASDGDSGYSYGLTSVDIGAPGSDIASTYITDSYVYASGTSMATPHVAGAAALVWSIAPELSAVEMKELLMTTGDDNAFLTGKTVSGKRLNVKNALDQADPDPSFSFNITPISQSVVAGELAEYSFEISAIAAWSGEVALGLDSELPGASLSASSGEPGDIITLSVPTTTDTAWGDYSFTVTGTSGDLVKQSSAELSVLPVGLFDVTYTSETPVAIPDNDANGITSTISIADSYTAFGTSAYVNITHTWSGDLVVALTSPSGTSFTLHNRSGGSDDDVVGEYETDAFNGELITGDWILSVSDNAGQDLGTLNSWSVTFSALAEETSVPPVAGFTFTTDDLTATFTDTSTDTNDDIVSWSWDFGDGSSSSTSSPMHTYALAGTYAVVLTVTDEDGNTDTFSADVSVDEAATIIIPASIRRAVMRPNGTLRTVLNWLPTPAPTVDIYRNGQIIATVGNSGTYVDAYPNAVGTEFSYQICDIRYCSDILTVSF